MKLTLSIFLSLILIVIHGQNQPSKPKSLDFDKLPAVQWKFKIKAPVFSSPVISEGTVYFGGTDSTVYAIDLGSGAIKWKLKTNGEIRSTVVIQDDLVYLSGSNGILSCINKNSGKIIWRSVFDNTALFLAERKYDFADYYQSSPLVNNHVIYLGSGNGRMHAFKEENGEVLWTFNAGDIIHNTPVLHKNKLFFGSFDGYVYALSASTGQLIWKFKSVGQRFFPKGEMQGSPMVANDLVYIGGRDYNVYALDVNEGHAHWNKSFQGGWALSNTVLDSVLYVGTSDERVLLAFDAISGQELWKTNVKFNIFGSCAFTPAMLYVGTIWGKVFGVDRKSGSIRWAFTTDGYNQYHLQYYKADDTFRDDLDIILKAPVDWIRAEYKMGGVFSTPAIAGDFMVITTTEGIIYCLKRS